MIPHSVKSPLGWLKSRSTAWNYLVWTLIDCAVGIQLLIFFVFKRHGTTSDNPFAEDTDTILKVLTNNVFNVKEMDLILHELIKNALFWCIGARSIIILTYVRTRRRKFGSKYFYRKHCDEYDALIRFLTILFLAFIPLLISIGSCGLSFSVTGVWSYKNEAPSGFDRWYELSCAIKLGIITALISAPTVFVSGMNIFGRRLPLMINREEEDRFSLDQQNTALDLPLYSAYGGLFVACLIVNWNGSIDGLGQLNYYGYPGIPLLAFISFWSIGAMFNLTSMITSLITNN